eukprot:scaffold21325_cov70-Phaeocystis_antarctica.AAC.2
MYISGIGLLNGLLAASVRYAPEAAGGGGTPWVGLGSESGLGLGCGRWRPQPQSNPRSSPDLSPEP